MITHHYVMPSVDGGTMRVPLTAEEARKIIHDALAQPPVQFDLLVDRSGWQINVNGHITQLMRVPPEFNN